MSAHISLHIHDGIEISSVHLASRGAANPDTALIRIKDGKNGVDLFVTDIADIDRMAFELETLARTLREEHNWTETKGNTNV